MGNLNIMNFEEICKKIDDKYEDDLEFLERISFGTVKHNYPGLKKLSKIYIETMDYSNRNNIKFNDISFYQGMALIDQFNTIESPCVRCDLPFSSKSLRHYYEEPTTPICSFCWLLSLNYLSYRLSVHVYIDSLIHYTHHSVKHYGSNWIPSFHRQAVNLYWFIDKSEGPSLYIYNFEEIMLEKNPNNILKLVRKTDRIPTKDQILQMDRKGRIDLIKSNEIDSNLRDYIFSQMSTVEDLKAVFSTVGLYDGKFIPRLIEISEDENSEISFIKENGHLLSSHALFDYLSDLSSEIILQDLMVNIKGAPISKLLLIIRNEKIKMELIQKLDNAIGIVNKNPKIIQGFNEKNLVILLRLGIINAYRFLSKEKSEYKQLLLLKILEQYKLEQITIDEIGTYTRAFFKPEDYEPFLKEFLELEHKRPAQRVRFGIAPKGDCITNIARIAYKNIQDENLKVKILEFPWFKIFRKEEEMRRKANKDEKIDLTQSEKKEERRRMAKIQEEKRRRINNDFYS